MWGRIYSFVKTINTNFGKQNKIRICGWFIQN